MQEVQPDSDETNQMLEDEGFEDAAFGLSLDPTIELLDVSAVTTPGSASNPALSSPASLQTAAASDRTEAPEQQLVIILFMCFIIL